MASQKIGFDKLKEWALNYDEHAYERETRNVVFSMQDIHNLVSYCDNHPRKAEINGIRFYLVRQNEFERDIVFGDQSQISLVAVPVVNFKDNEFDANGVLIKHDGGQDLQEANEVFAAFPLSDDHEHGGLCPYNCRGSITDIAGKP